MRQTAQRANCNLVEAKLREKNHRREDETLFHPADESKLIWDCIGLWMTLSRMKCSLETWSDLTSERRETPPWNDCWKISCGVDFVTSLTPLHLLAANGGHWRPLPGNGFLTSLLIFFKSLERSIKQRLPGFRKSMNAIGSNRANRSKRNPVIQSRKHF